MYYRTIKVKIFAVKTHNIKRSVKSSISMVIQICNDIYDIVYWPKDPAKSWNVFSFLQCQGSNYVIAVYLTEILGKNAWGGAFVSLCIIERQVIK